MNACTIVARNYLAHARVLAESFRRHHPSGCFTTLVLDARHEELATRAEPFRVLDPYEIGIERAELDRMAMIYDVMELATAVKPWLLRTLLEEGISDVSYFDPDIEIHAPLDDVCELARRHSIVLIPHATIPKSATLAMSFVCSIDPSRSRSQRTCRCGRLGDRPRRRTCQRLASSAGQARGSDAP